MDQILQIFTQLGIDQSLFYQFGLFVIIFFILKIIFFDELLFVIETREAKTTKLDSLAREKLEKANQLALQYDERITSFHQEAQKNLKRNKEQMEKEKVSRIREEENRLMENFEKERSELIADLGQKRAKVVKSAEELSEDLVKKLTS